MCWHAIKIHKPIKLKIQNKAVYVLLHANTLKKGMIQSRADSSLALGNQLRKRQTEFKPGEVSEN